MIKKNKLIIQTLTIILVLAISNICFADGNPYEYNYKYERVSVHAGVSTYLEKESVDVYEYNPPLYVIAGNFVRFLNSREGQILNPVFIVIQYDYNTKETYSRRNGIWEKMVVNSSSVGLENKAIANALFRAAYGMEFYRY